MQSIINVLIPALGIGSVNWFCIIKELVLLGLCGCKEYSH